MHDDVLSVIEDKVRHAVRLSRDDAAFLFRHASMSDLSRLASTARARFHAPGDATFLVMAIVNYTNVCVAKCDYCSFYRLPEAPDAYLLGFEEVCAKVDAARAHGGTLVGFNGGFHPSLRVSDYTALFGLLHARYPEIDFFEMTVAEFMFVCKVSKITYAEGARMLRAVGTRWVTGGGAEVLDDAFRRRHSPGKYRVADFYTAQRAILDAGIGSTATMVIGFGEPLSERLHHLEGLRSFQDETGGGLASFLCWTYKSFGNELGGSEVSDEEYLRWLAVSRLYLDNFVHIRTSVLTKNESALEGLRFGANDFDLPTEDEVTQKAGAQVSLDFARILRHAEQLGFRTVHRNSLPRLPRAGAAYVASGLAIGDVLTRGGRIDVPLAQIARRPAVSDLTVGTSPGAGGGGASSTR